MDFFPHFGTIYRTECIVEIISGPWLQRKMMLVDSERHDSVVIYFLFVSLPIVYSRPTYVYRLTDHLEAFTSDMVQLHRGWNKLV